jgi:Uma2 family endonuclease
MVATPIAPSTTTSIDSAAVAWSPPPVELPDHTELVDGELIEKTGMTIKHGIAQTNIASEWRAYVTANHIGGKVCTEAACRTVRQTRRPDVAYMTEAMLQQHSQATILPECFPLIAEIASPDDKAEDLFAKTAEYLESGCQEVWLLFPETLLVMVVTPDQWQVFRAAQAATTQAVLPGFSLAVEALLT